MIGVIISLLLTCYLYHMDIIENKTKVENAIYFDVNFYEKGMNQEKYFKGEENKENIEDNNLENKQANQHEEENQKGRQLAAELAWKDHPHPALDI